MKRIILLIILTFILSGCNLSGSDSLDNSSKTVSGINEEIKKTDTEATLSFYGDLLIHDSVFKAAKQNDGRYNFEKQFSKISPYLKKSDFVTGNLETNFAGKSRGYTGYPAFNAPEELRFYLRDTLNTSLLVNANNHCLDKGLSGLKSTLSYLDDAGIYHTGTFAEKEDSEKVLIVDIKGIKVAFLNYTYGTNGIPLPKDNEYSVNLIDKSKIKSDAFKARIQGAEFIVAVLHWGTEYVKTPTDDQKSLAGWIFENTEVDTLVGHHPHVVGTIEEIDYEKSGEMKKGIVAYSLGNFTGDQHKSYTDSGIIVNFTLVKSGLTKDVTIKDYNFIPTYIDKNPGTPYDFRIINVFEGIKSYEKGQDKLITKEEYTRLNVIADNYKNEVSKCGSVTMNTGILGSSNLK